MLELGFQRTQLGNVIGDFIGDFFPTYAPPIPPPLPPIPPTVGAGPTAGQGVLSGDPWYLLRPLDPRVCTRVGVDIFPFEDRRRRRTRRERECDQLYEADCAICREIQDPADRAVCWENALRRWVNCQQDPSGTPPRPRELVPGRR